jgi:long-chain acyl-CoA synthetase
MEAKLVLGELSRYKIGTWAEIIRRHSLLTPKAPAFKYGDLQINYEQFNKNVNRLVNALKKLGLKKGDVMGVISWNCMDYVYIIGAAMKGGFIFSPYNARFGQPEFEYVINYSTANTLFFGPEMAETVKQLRPMIPNVKNYISLETKSADSLFINDLMAEASDEEPGIEIDPNDPVTIIYTSGTTGKPKGALYTHIRGYNNSMVYLTAQPTKSTDRNILAMQLFHIAGNEFMQVLLFIGGFSILVKNLDAVTVMETIQNEKATIVALVPTVLASIFNLPDFNKYDRSSLSRIHYLGGPMPVALLKKGIDKFGLVFVQMYGQTESGPLMACLPKEMHTVAFGSEEDQKILRSCGKPVIGVQLRIVDENGNDVKPGEVGEIVARNQEHMVEYWKKPKETSETIIDGWLHTHDMAYYDEDGYLYIADRKQDMIITGGEHVFPREVEEVLYQHPDILEAAVIGIPDPYWIEKVHACVVLKPNSKLTIEEIISYCKNKMSRYKAPKSVELMPVLPKTVTGKILKTELRKKYAEKKS